MPIYDETSPATSAPRVSVRSSAVIELGWVLHSALQPHFAEDHPALRAVFDDHPELLGLVRGLWHKDGQTGAAGFAELILLAAHGGFLFTDDGDVMLERLPEACATVPTTAKAFPMRAESEEDRRLVLRRVARLRRSATMRRTYTDVLTQVWVAASGSWDRYGRAAVAGAATAMRATLAKGGGWRDLAKGACDEEALDRAEARLEPGDEVVVVPAYYAHVGLLFDLPGTLVVGVRAPNGGAESRARSERLARRLRSISDPTRLAILDSLRSGPATVTELAARFGLAQPTVSNHVKLLKDSGVVADVRDGTRRNLVVQEGVVRDLMDELGGLLAPRGAAEAPDR